MQVRGDTSRIYALGGSFIYFQTTCINLSKKSLKIPKGQSKNLSKYRYRFSPKTLASNMSI
jgi:hypothetical protein